MAAKDQQPPVSGAQATRRDRFLRRTEAGWVSLPMVLMLIALATLITLWFAYRASAGADGLRIGERLLRLDRDHAGASIRSGSSPAFESALRDLAAEPHVLLVAAIDEQGRVAQSSLRASVGLPATQALPNYRDQQGLNDVGEGGLLMRREKGHLLAYQPRASGDGLLYLVFDEHAAEAAHWSAALTPPHFALLALLGSALLAGGLLYRLWQRQLNGLQQAMHTMALSGPESDAVDAVESHGTATFAPLWSGLSQLREQMLDLIGQQRATEDSVQALLDAADSGVLVTDIQGRVRRLNQVAEQLTGWMRTEALGCYAHELIKLRDVHSYERLTSGVEQVLSQRDRSCRRERCMLVSREGWEVIVAEHAAPIYADDAFTGVLIVLRNVTHDSLRQEVLERGDERFRAMVETTTDWFWEVDARGRLSWCGPQSQALFGLSPKSLLGRTPCSLMAEEDALLGTEKFRALVASGTQMTSFVSRYRHTAGHTVVLEARGVPMLDEDLKVIGYRGVSRDVTAHQQTEEQLRLAATAFETHEGLFITDANGCILRCNRAFTQLTGYSAEEVLGETMALFDASEHDGEFYHSLLSDLHAHGNWEGEFHHRCKSGAIMPSWLSINAVRTERRKVSHYVAAFIDLTELKSQQARIERSAAEEQVLGELLRLAMQTLPLKAFLGTALRQLLDAVPWVGLQPRGGILLTDTRGEASILRLATQVGLEEEIQSLCAEVPFGHCHCGRAAKTGKTQFSNCVDHCHDTRFPGMAGHGHYNVPIRSANTVLGVLLLYLPEGHVYAASEQAFLERVADVLGMAIVRHRAEAAIEYQAYHDALTGLPNRSLLLDRLQQDLAVTRRRSRAGALLLIDLDHFRHLNDALGHPAGDDLLCELSKALLGTIRAEDTVARLGGDEFAVLLPDIADNEHQSSYRAREVAEKLLATISRPYHLAGSEYQLTASIGISLFPQGSETMDDVLRHADAALNRAKEAGRNTIRFFSQGMQQVADRRLQLSNDLRRALREGEFALHYQSQVDADGRLVGAEALLRWQHPTLGVVGPADFIPLAEDSGMIVPIGQWVIDEACRQLAEWRAQGILGALEYLALNVSPKQFHQDDFISGIEACVQRHGIDANRLELELTEGVFVDNFEQAVSKMNALRQSGIRFAIDDFGTGYSSLSYLKRLPLSKLKIDRSFVRDIVFDANDATLVRTIIAMAEHLGLSVVAEGVEHAEQLEMLREMDCGYYQGFRFGLPMDAAQFAECHAGAAPAGDVQSQHSS